MRWVGLIAIVCVLAASAFSGALAQSLPRSVADPYLRYQAAQEAGDLVAAQAAAGEAYNAAVAAGLDRGTIGVLAEIYGFSASQNGDTGIAFDLLRTAAEIADETRASASDRAWRWSLAAEAADAFGQTDLAMVHADASLAALAEFRVLSEADQPIAADMHYLRMRILRARGDIAGAGSAAARALTAYRAAGRELDGQYGLIFYNLGAADYAAERWADARTHYRFAVALLNDAGASEQAVWSAWTFAELSRLLNEDEEGGRDAPSYPDIAAEMDAQNRAAARQLERADYLEIDGFQEAEVEDADEVEFPDQAGNQQGFVLVRFDVDAQGRTENVRAVFQQPRGVFADAATDAISRRVYTPARIGNDAVRREGMLQLVMFADGRATASDYSFSTEEGGPNACTLTGSDWREGAELGRGNARSCLAGQGSIYQRGYRGERESSQCPNPGQCGGQ